MSAEDVERFKQSLKGLDGDAVNQSHLDQLLSVRKNLTIDEWREIGSDLREKYYTYISERLKQSLEKLDETKVHEIFAALPKQDLFYSSMHDFAENYIFEHPTKPDQLKILLTAPNVGKKTTNYTYPFSPAIRAAVKSHDATIFRLLLDKFPRLDSASEWHNFLQDTVPFDAANPSTYDLQERDCSALLFLLNNDIHQHLNQKHIFNEVLNYCLKIPEVDLANPSLLSAVKQQHLKDAITIIHQLFSENIFSNVSPSEFDTIGKSPLFLLLPRPSKDPAYKAFYYILEAIWTRHLLAHRADLRGQTQVGKFFYDIHGSSQAVMVPEVLKSFREFSASPASEIAKKQLMESELGLSADQVHTLFKTVEQDIQNTLMALNIKDNNSMSQLQKLLYPGKILMIPPTVKAKGDNNHHAIAITLFNDLCLIADRDRANESGIEIYQLTGSFKEQTSAKIKVALQLANTVTLQGDYSNLIEQANFNAEMMQKLSLKKIGFMPLSEQYGENCAWSSSAKMLLLNAFYCRIFEAATKAKHSPADAHAIAQREAKKLFSLWSHNDKLTFYQKYIEHYKKLGLPEFGPDKTLLSMIYLRVEKNSRKQDIAQLLLNSGLVTPESLDMAKIKTRSMAQDILSEEFEQYSALMKDRILLGKIIDKFVTLFLQNGKKKVQTTFQEVKTALEGNRLDDILPILDRALEKSTPSESPTKKPPLRFSTLKEAGEPMEESPSVDSPEELARKQRPL